MTLPRGPHAAFVAVVMGGGLVAACLAVHRLAQPETMIVASSGANPTKSPAGPVPPAFFGLTVLNFRHLSPSMPFGMTRSWDAGPGLAWSEMNPSRGLYRFEALDEFMAFNQAHHSEALYTFGRTPRWASSRPDDPTAPYGPGQCAPPADLHDWDGYVTAIATHAAGRIRFWEVWNEPNETAYCGNTATLVQMAEHAHRILHQVDPNAVVLTPSADKASGPAWLASFFSAGGSGTVDGIALHGYWSAHAEDIVPVVTLFRQTAASAGAGNLPVWDTESSWAYTSTMPLPSPADQAGYIAKSYLLHWSLGVSRFVWYAYDGGSPWGTLFANSVETPAAFAYRESYRWLAGASMTAPCTRAKDQTWTCPLARPGGYTALAVWNSKRPTKLRVPKQYGEYLDLGDVTHPVVNGSVMANDLPILLQSGTLP